MVFEGYNSYSLQINRCNGYEADEIKQIGIRNPKRIGNSEQIDEHKKVGLNFAKEVLKNDTDKIISFINLRKLTLDYLRFKYQNHATILEMLPSKYDSMKDWFKKDDYTYPAYLSKPGTVSEDVKNNRDNFINKIKSELFK